MTVGAKGMKQGKNPKSVVVFVNSASNLSRHSLFHQALRSISHLSRIAGKEKLDLGLKWKEVDSIMRDRLSYQQAKRLMTPQHSQQLRNILCEIDSPLLGWMRSSSDGDFFQHYCSDKND